MGKLHVDKDDISRLAELLKKDVEIADNNLIVDLGGPKLSLTNLNTTGFFEQNGIRFQINARFESGALNVDFE